MRRKRRRNSLTLLPLCSLSQLFSKKKKKKKKTGPSQRPAPPRAHRRLFLRSWWAELGYQGDVPEPQQAHDHDGGRRGRRRPSERGWQRRRRQRRGLEQSCGGERERVQRPLLEPQERLWRRRRRDLVFRRGLLQERGRHHQGGEEEEVIIGGCEKSRAGRRRRRRRREGREQLE